MEGDNIIFMLFPYDELILLIPQCYHLVYDGAVGEVRISLQYVLMVEYQLIEYGAAVNLYALASDAAVRIKPYLSALAYYGSLKESQKVLHILWTVRAKKGRAVHI